MLSVAHSVAHAFFSMQGIQIHGSRWKFINHSWPIGRRHFWNTTHIFIHLIQQNKLNGSIWEHSSSSISIHNRRHIILFIFNNHIEYHIRVGNCYAGDLIESLLAEKIVFCSGVGFKVMFSMQIESIGNLRTIYMYRQTTIYPPISHWRLTRLPI